MPLKIRFTRALPGWEPYLDPTDPDQPSFAEYSMMGQCPVHGLERIVSEKTVGRADPTAVFFFLCGEADPASLG